MSTSKAAESGERFEVRIMAPEGGWGYVICIGMALPFICALGSMPSFGLMYGDFLTGLGEETSAIALITCSFFSSFSFAGLITNTLFRKFSIRSVGVGGASIYFLGSLMAVFVTSVEQLLFAFSVLQGAGFGLMIPVAYTTFNAYFVTRRVLMMSIAQALIGLGTMFYPILVQFLMDTYGFRGSIAVLAAINGHAVFGMLAMHPVQWHQKRVQVPVPDKEETKAFLHTSDGTEVKIIIVSDDGTEPNLNDDDEDNTLKTNGLIVPKRPSFKMNKSMESIVKSERSASLDPLQLDVNQYDVSQRRASSISSLGNWTGAVVVSDASACTRKETNEKWRMVVDFLDLTLLNDPVYVNIVLGLSFALYSDVAFFTLQPMYLFQLGYSKSDTALIIAGGAAADLFSRVFLAIASLCVQVKARNVYLTGAILTILSRFLFLEVIDFNEMLAVTAFMGFLRTWLHVPLPLVFAEYLSSERFPSGYGLFMFLQGNITFAIGPFIGWIRDVTQSYEFSFHCLTCIMAMCAVPWLIEIVVDRFVPKKTKK